jgi:two-component system chemotaxis response regulator CheY
LNFTNDKKLILLVEDDFDVLESVRDLLVIFGYDVITASDGLLAVEKYDEHTPDLVLMDVKMPKMDGYEAFFKIKQGHNDAKVILMTGFGGDPRQDEAKNFGLVGILEKPPSPQFLEDYLGSILTNVPEIY